MNVTRAFDVRSFLEQELFAGPSRFLPAVFGVRKVRGVDNVADIRSRRSERMRSTQRYALQMSERRLGVWHGSDIASFIPLELVSWGGALLRSPRDLDPS